MFINLKLCFSIQPYSEEEKQLALQPRQQKPKMCLPPPKQTALSQARLVNEFNFFLFLLTWS